MKYYILDNVCDVPTGYRYTAEEIRAYFGHLYEPAYRYYLVLYDGIASEIISRTNALGNAIVWHAEISERCICAIRDNINDIPRGKRELTDVEKAIKLLEEKGKLKDGKILV